MAVEIKEVIVRAILYDEEKEREDETGSNVWEGGDREGVETEELIEMCVEQVLRILKRKNYR